ncbi:LamG-like jellyroll fold domain-containing protein [Flavisolibacter ginsenosidimutans]|uniref:T9SS type A sorting domain-containing protein n=1 Tax=Flavisolibacter ginsenosidimutans TaxID=661481 RepID=A0A5B8UNZ7_9BACT|nr:LamG-like jellyroll fold domain-containing protein [Flavisolibacter ginsenosidimutans]QEC57949.1 T9SS type A sorting domain-containing protein [Flavisolibacter ginsenosidimutans]
MKKMFTLFLAVCISAVAFTQNNGLHFDGVDDYVEINAPNNFLSGSAFTIELWYKPTAASQHEQTLISRGSGNSFWEIGNNGKWDNASSLFFYHPLSYPLEDFGVYSYDFSILNQWHHVAVTSDGNTLRFYHDGRMITQDPVDGPLGSATGPIRLGAPTGYTSVSSPTFDGGYFSGVMDELRIWSVARTAEEIQADRQREIPGNASGLVAYYNFNQGVIGGTNGGVVSLTNNTGSGLNGTLTNFGLSGNSSNWVAGFPIAGALPVRLVDFSAQQINAGTKLNWTTTMEDNVRVFEIERSTDARSFARIGEAIPKGTANGSQYSFVDRTPTEKTNYYRLRTVDRDGTSFYSQIVSVGKDLKNAISVFPNPVEHQLNIQLNSREALPLSILDVHGRIVKTLRMHPNTQSVSIDVSGLYRGNYFIQVGANAVGFVKL